MMVRSILSFASRCLCFALIPSDVSLRQLDVDFVILATFRDRLQGAGGGELRRLLRTGTAALVVPAFEYVAQEDGLDAEKFPKDKPVSSHFSEAALSLLIGDADLFILPSSGTPATRRRRKDQLVPHLMASRAF